MFVAFRTIGAVARSERGFTLIELLVAATLSVTILTAVLTAFEHAQNVQSRDTEWAHVVQESRTALNTMVAQMRQAYYVRRASEEWVEFYERAGGKSWGVLYNCETTEPETEFKECVRKQVEFEGSTPPSESTVAAAKAEPVIHDVLNGTSAESAPVFQKYSPSPIAPDLITVKIVMPASGTLKLAGAETYQHHIVLENGAYLRNTAVGT